MSPRSIREYAVTIRPRYLAAPLREKARILTEFCRVTEYHRKSAIRLLRRAPGPPRGRPGRPRRYHPPVTRALQQVWEASDALCSKRLAPFLPELVDALERHGTLILPPAIRRDLLSLSLATIDRLLKPLRPKGLRRPHSSRPSLHSLKVQVPIRTFGEWTAVRPGALQADLVAHCGETLAGFHLTSLVVVDVATGWTELQAVWGKNYHRVATAVHFVRKRLPFPIRELHTDNGGEFLNSILLPWCRRERIRLTRGRPYRKNDQAYAEQKNWSAVRRLIGYDRYSSAEAFKHLNHLYSLLRLYLNFFQPIAKLTGKVRLGARVTKRYDRAQTPYQRLLAANVLDTPQQQALQRLYLTLNPCLLRDQIYQSLHQLFKMADRPTEVTPFLGQRTTTR
ncbi:MAG: transposase family protein [Armatimonadetes bacterium]|nr:transposase family protein [Armatimonadota bacterium]